jgi:hypothetical protein
MRRFRIPALIGSVLVLCASVTAGQEARRSRSRVYRVYPEQVELYLTTASLVSPAGFIRMSPDAQTAEIRLGLEQLQFESETFAERAAFRQAHAGDMPAYCPIGWWHLHLGTVPCPREPFGACTAICWAHPMCGATMSWTAGSGLCQDTCECYPDGSP